MDEQSSSALAGSPDRGAGGGGFIRLIAILGIVYAIFSFLEFLNFRFLFNGNGRLLLWRVPYLAFRALTELSSIALFIGSLQLLRHRPGARAVLFGWSIAILTLQMLYLASLRVSQAPASVRDIQTIAGNFVLIWQDCGFPLVLLFTMNLPQDGGTGFSVILRHSQALPGGDPVVAAAATGEIQRRITWVGLLLGAAGVIGIALHLSGWTMTRWQSADSPWRAATLKTLATIGLFSYLLLLTASILTLVRHRWGRAMLLAWSVLFLAIQLASAMLFDVLFVYWQASNGPLAGIREFGEQASSHLYAILRICAFPIVVAYCLGWSQRARAAEGGWRHEASTGSATNPATDGL